MILGDCNGVPALKLMRLKSELPIVGVDGSKPSLLGSVSSSRRVGAPTGFRAFCIPFANRGEVDVSELEDKFSRGRLQYLQRYLVLRSLRVSAIMRKTADERFLRIPPDNKDSSPSYGNLFKDD